MVNIKLDSTYSIGSDNLQWILLEKERAKWFFRNLSSLLESYLMLKSRQSNARDIHQLLNYQKKLIERLSQALNNIPKQDWEGKND